MSEKPAGAAGSLCSWVAVSDQLIDHFKEWTLVSSCEVRLTRGRRGELEVESRYVSPLLRLRAALERVL